MPKKKKVKTKEPEKKVQKPTYHKSKNGRYYRKSVLPNGRRQCRFCSKAEAEGGSPDSTPEPVSHLATSARRPVADSPAKSPTMKRRRLAALPPNRAR